MTSPQLSPEVALTIACCRWPRSPARDAAVRAAARAVTDWDVFERLLVRHRVTPLVRDGLACAGVTLPEPLATRLADRAAETALMALVMARESVRLQSVFDAAGLSVLLLKGSVVGVLAYGDPCMKESWDIDVLISQDRIADGHKLLIGLGYTLQNPAGFSLDELERFARYAIEAVYVNRESGLAVELHWRLSRNQRLLPAVTVRSASQGVRVAGAELRTLSDELLFAYLCAHGTKHGWARMKWLADLNAFISARDEDTVERLYRAAVEAGAGRAPAVSLLLCRDLLGLSLAPSLVRELESGPRIGLLRSAAFHCVTGRTAPSDPGAWLPLRLRFSLLFLMPGAGYALEQLRNTWDHPFEHARHGSGFHILRIPRWLVRRAKGVRRRLARRPPQEGIRTT